MNSEEWTQLANSFVLEVINNTEGISFVEFKNSDKLREHLAPPVRGSIDPWVELGSTKAYDEVEVSNWLLAAIKSEDIHGKVVMMWSDLDRRGIPDYVEVILSKDYDWVVPLWMRGRALSIYSFERGYAWKAIQFEGRYAFFRINLKDYQKK